MNRTPTKRSLGSIPMEDAHGGAGSRQLIFSKADQFVSSQFEAMTKGFLPSKASYDWHKHDGVDELFWVVSGSGSIEYEDGKKFPYQAGDTFYSPAGIAHKIENLGDAESVFFFIRLKE